MTGETEESVTQFLDQHGKDWTNSINSVDALKEKIEAEEKLINRNPAAFSALEIALLELFSQKEHVPIEGLLELPLLSDDIQYSSEIDLSQGAAAPRPPCSELSRFASGPRAPSQQKNNVPAS